MKRRDIIAGLASRVLARPPKSMRLSRSIFPSAQLVKDRTFLHEFMDEYSFVDLVTGSPEIRITHIPVLLDRSAGKNGKLYGHISRQNPQSGTFDGEHHAVIVFRGRTPIFPPPGIPNRRSCPRGTLLSFTRAEGPNR